MWNETKTELGKTSVADRRTDDGYFYFCIFGRGIFVCRYGFSLAKPSEAINAQNYILGVSAAGFSFIHFWTA